LGKIANIKQTTAKSPYELSLTSKYKYILEGAGMGWCANENGPAKAFLSLKLQATGLYQLQSLAYIIVVPSHLRD